MVLLTLCLRNRNNYMCFPTVISYRSTSGSLGERKVVVTGNTIPSWRVFPCDFVFSQTSTSVSMTYGNTGQMFPISFLK